MPRVIGVDIPGDKPTMYSLRYIYGIGPTTALQVCEKAQVDPNVRCKDLNDEQLTHLTAVLQGYKIEGDLRREVSMNVKRLTEIGCYRGLRHRRNLPVHGQRTRTNSRTRKGPKKTVAGRGRRRGATKK